jgi:hypothetical protein
MNVRESLLVALRGSEALFDRTPSNDLTGEFADCCALWLLKKSVPLSGVAGLNRAYTNRALKAIG